MYLKRIEKEYPVKRNLINKAVFFKWQFPFLSSQQSSVFKYFWFNKWEELTYLLLIFVCCLTSRLRIFGLYLDIAITNEGIQYSTYARQLRFLSIVWFFLRHTCCDSLILEVTLKYYCSTVSYPFVNRAEMQWVRVLDPQAEGWVFESQSLETLVVKTGSDSATAKRSALGVSVTGHWRWPYINRCP